MLPEPKTMPRNRKRHTTKNNETLCEAEKIQDRNVLDFFVAGSKYNTKFLYLSLVVEKSGELIKFLSDFMFRKVRVLFKKIFSVDNQGYHKIVFFMGMKIKIRRKAEDVLPHINRKKVSKEIAVFTENGVNQQQRNPRLIVSLTSFPQRIGEIQYTLYSLLKQTCKPDAVILWLAEDEFPNREKDIPAD